MSDLTSPQGQSLEVIRDTIRELDLAIVRDPGEVQARRNFFTDYAMHVGITVHPFDEQIGGGPIGTQDVNYPIAVTFVQRDSGDAIISDDSMEQSVREVRQRLHEQRIGLGNLPSIKEHVCRVSPSAPKYDRKKFHDFRVRQLLVNVWGRELNYVGQ